LCYGSDDDDKEVKNLQEELGIFKKVRWCSTSKSEIVAEKEPI
jgi:hypothetical protein